MAGVTPTSAVPVSAGEGPRAVTREPAAVRVALIAATVLYLGLFLAVPLAEVFAEALRKGLQAAAFAVASLLALLAVATLVAKALVECRLALRGDAVEMQEAS